MTRAFVTHLKKIRPDIEIADQQWPKLGEADYNPFINAQMAKKPDAVFSSLWGGHFVTFAKQAKALKYFESFGFNFLGAGEAGAIETTKAMGDDYPFGIWANAYDAFNWDGPPAHKEYIARLRAYIEGGASLVVADHRLHGHADPDGGDRQGRQHRLRQGRGGMLDITVDTPIGKQTIRAKDHQANRAQFWGKMTKDPKYPFAVMSPPVYIDPAPFMD